MKILTIGDVVSAAGCACLRKRLPALKREYGVDFVIVNGENSAVGNGMLPGAAEHIFDSGANVITGGNHTLKRREFYPYLEEHPMVLRPANFHPSAPGCGSVVVDFGRLQLGVLNLMGTVFLDPLENPFDCAQREIAALKAEGCSVILVDFHAEATAEKRAMGFFLDGQISALFGTHTHVQTSDAQVLPGGTGYITDLGMTGVVQSVLGVEPQLAIENLRTHLPVRFQNPEGPCALEGCLFEVEEKSGRCLSAAALRITDQTGKGAAR